MIFECTYLSKFFLGYECYIIQSDSTTEVENGNLYFRPLSYVSLAMRHADDEHMMIHNYINNDDDDDDDQINQIKPDELKMELDFIEQLIRKTKYQLY
ncbi:unnamed protein product [Rotaria sp. Silwood2]|nr:unnamed protein product [Rotaria sp. Silwood2]